MARSYKFDPDEDAEVPVRDRRQERKEKRDRRDEPDEQEGLKENRRDRVCPN